MIRRRSCRGSQLGVVGRRLVFSRDDVEVVAALGDVFAGERAESGPASAFEIVASALVAWSPPKARSEVGKVRGQGAACACQTRERWCAGR